MANHAHYMKCYAEEVEFADTADREIFLPLDEACDDELILKRRPTNGRRFWSRLASRLRRFSKSRGRYDPNRCFRCGLSVRRRRLMDLLTLFGLVPLALLGVLQLYSIICNVVSPTSQLQGWDAMPVSSHGLPLGITKGIQPIRLHSHNDYTREVPLYSALNAGCTSIEADVWFVDGELYVGHYERNLMQSKTLTSMYLAPLLEILDRQNMEHSNSTAFVPNGVFEENANQTLILLIDFKNLPNDTWHAVSKALDPLRSRGYLTFWNGDIVEERPITVVGTGETPLDRVNSELYNPHRDIFYDAPLDEMTNENLASRYSTANTYYASVSFRKIFGRLWSFKFTPKQLATLREQVAAAHGRGLKVRYWSLPDWPRFLRNEVWTKFLQEGVDLLNVDDLKAASALYRRVSGIDVGRHTNTQLL